MNVLDTLSDINIDVLSKSDKEELLKQIRLEIDSIDDSLAELLNYRASKYEILSILKKQLKLKNYSPQREEKILNRITRNNKSNLSSNELIQIFERIIDVSRAIQKRSRDKS
jgi:chorismate mutase